MTTKAHITIGNLSGIAHPTQALRSRLQRMGLGGQVSVERLLDGEVAVDALARLLTEAVETNTTSDGRIDMRDVASHVLREMGRHQK